MWSKEHGRIRSANGFKGIGRRAVQGPFAVWWHDEATSRPCFDDDAGRFIMKGVRAPASSIRRGAFLLGCAIASIPRGTVDRLLGVDRFLEDPVMNPNGFGFFSSVVARHRFKWP